MIQENKAQHSDTHVLEYILLHSPFGIRVCELAWRGTALDKAHKERSMGAVISIAHALCVLSLFWHEPKLALTIL